MMEDKTYFSYLLRIWRVVRGGENVWLASLDEPHTGKRHSFTSLESLFAFLLRQSQEADRCAETRSDQSHSSAGEGQNDRTPQA
jgi:hypothetical protein